MRIISIFALITILLITIFSVSTRPVVHKQYILAPQDFKLDGLSHRPSDLQSVQMFKIGEAPVRVVSTDMPTVETSAEAPIIPSDVQIIPSDFIQQVPPQRDNTSPASEVDNSDKMLEQVGKMLETVQEPASSQKPNPKPNPSKQDNVKNNDKPAGTGCSLCDALFDPKVRAELIAWNKWRSDIQNNIMDISDVNAPYGTLFYFTFEVDNNKRISNIHISSRGGSEADKKAIRRAILSLNGSRLLEFPKGSSRKKVSFSGGFLMSDYELYSSPSDYKDFEYVQSAF